MTFALSEGTPEARAHFTRGLLALHSFWYDEAIRQFDAAIAADPTMNMAYWGAALSRCKLLWGDDDIGAARALLSRMPNADGLGPRDRAWVLALIELLRADDVRTSRKKFAGAMETVYAQFPDDESATFLAIALLSATHPEDPDTIAVRKRVAALAIGVFEHNPKHPGAAHYLIHAYDTPELATLALPYAREYAKIAPAAFHARHMPAHIFSRLGMWQEAIASCQSAWDASVAAAARDKLSANHDDFHSLHWLVEMPFELGHRKDADAAMTTFANAVRGGVGRQYRALYANQVSSYMMRTGDWSRVEELLSPLDKPAVEDTDPMAPAAATRAGAPAAHCAPEPASGPFPLLEQVTILDARARASAAQHDLAKTKSYLAEIEALRQKLHPFFVATQKEALPKLEQTHTRHRLALLAQAARDDQALLKLQRQSAIADADQESSGGESNPSGFQSHDELADTLMRLERPKEAAAEYALALHSHPGRARSLLGGARAAKAMGDLPVAQKLYQQLLAQWSTADETTDGLAEARAAR